MSTEPMNPGCHKFYICIIAQQNVIDKTPAASSIGQFVRIFYSETEFRVKFTFYSQNNVLLMLLIKSLQVLFTLDFGV